MHYRSCTLAISLIAVNSALACESERPIADDLLRMAAGDQPAAGGAGSHDAGVSKPAAPVDASVADEPPPDASDPPRTSSTPRP